MAVSRASTPSEGNLSWSKTDDSLMDAVGRRDVSKVRSLVKKKSANPMKISPQLGVAAIHQAASFDKSDILDELLMFPSMDVNQTDARKRTALHHAVREGREECLNRLILMNANTTLVENEGLTALHLASMLGHMGCLRLLVCTVQSVDARDDKGRTALFYAASRGSASSCRLLLEYGANIDATDKYGRTALMMTAENGHQAAFHYLLSRRANVSIRDNKGRDVRWYAINYNHPDFLLSVPNSTDRRRNTSDTSNEEDERLAPSSQRRLAKKWGPEINLSSADPERTPGQRVQNQIHPSTTDSERRSNSVLEEKVNVRAVTFMQHQAPNEVNERKEQEWTAERLELIRKLTDLADENKELTEWKAKAESTEQQSFNLLTSQKQIYPLMEEVYRSVESCRRRLQQGGTAEDGGRSNDDDANVSSLREASQTLTLILQSMYEAGRSNAQGSTDELLGNAFSEEMSRRDGVIRELERRVEEYDREMERLEKEIRKLNQLVGGVRGQQDRIREQEEELVQLQLMIQDQNLSLRKFGSVKEALIEITGLDDVSEDQAADVIRQISVQYQKLQTKYKALKVKHREVETTLSEHHLKSSTVSEALTERPSNNNSSDHDGDDWRTKTIQDLRIMKGRSATPISVLLREQLIVLRKGLESQIDGAAPQSKDHYFDDKSGSLLDSEPPPAAALRKLEGYTNGTDEVIIRGKDTVITKTEVIHSKPRGDFSKPQSSRTSDCHSMDEDERMRYETEIRQLRYKIELLRLEDSGVRTISTDDAEDDNNHVTLMMSHQQTMQSPFPDGKSAGILMENRRLKSELEKLRGRIQPMESRDAVVANYHHRTEQEVRTDSKGMQTDADELLKEVMLSRMASSYEKELLEKVESLKNQNAQLRSEIEALSVQRKTGNEKHESNVISEHVGSLGAGHDVSPPSARSRSMEGRERGKRRSQEESDDSSGESVDSGETRRVRGSNPTVAEKAKKRKHRRSENGEQRNSRDFDVRRRSSSLSSLSDASRSSNEEYNKITHKKHSREHMTKKTNNTKIGESGNKNRNTAGTSSEDETFEYVNKIPNESSQLHNVILPDRTTDVAPRNPAALLTAEFAQKVLVKKLMNEPDPNTPQPNPRGSLVTRVKTTPVRLPSDAARGTRAPDLSTQVSSPTASMTAVESNSRQRISRNDEKTKTSSTRRRHSSSASSNDDDETFESMFQVNQDVIIDPLKTVNSESSTNEARRRKTKIKLLRFDAQAKSRLETDLETMIQENARLREEMSALTAEIRLLKETASVTSERTDLLPATSSKKVKRVSTRNNSAVSKGSGQPATSQGISTGRPVGSIEIGKGQSLGSIEFSVGHTVTSKGIVTGESVSSISAGHPGSSISTGQPMTSISKGHPVASISTGQHVASISTGQLVTSKEISTGQPVSSIGTVQSVSSKEIRTVQPVTSAGVEAVSHRRVTTTSTSEEEEEAKSQDEEGGYRFLSEDEHGTLTFKEFSQQTSSHFSHEGEKEKMKDHDLGSDDDDLSHSLVSSTSGSTSLNSTDEVERDVRDRRPNGQRRKKREEGKEGKLKRKVSNDTQRSRIVVSNQAEPPVNWSNHPQHHLYKQQQHLSRKSAELRLSKGNKLEALNNNSVKSEKEILVVNGETLTDADKTKIFALQKQLQESEKIYKAIIGTYRSHLLASIQGCLDSDVADALCRIVTLQSGRLLEY